MRSLANSDASLDSTLEELDWLIGEWVDESNDITVATNYRWADGHNYILTNFKVQQRARRPCKATSASAGTRPQRRSSPGCFTPTADLPKAIGPGKTIAGSSVRAALPATENRFRRPAF